MARGESPRTREATWLRVGPRPPARPQLHAPFWQVVPPMQVFLHCPQFASLCRFASHPSLALPLQSPNPVLHDRIAQCPEAQSGVAFGTTHGAAVQLPQWSGSWSVSTSHPSSGAPLQSWLDPVQAATAQRPLLPHREVAFFRAQGAHPETAHPLRGSGLWQLESQSLAPEGHDPSPR